MSTREIERELQERLSAAVEAYRVQNGLSSEEMRRLVEGLLLAPNKPCDHAGWNWKDHGRGCPTCGAIVCDPGD